MVDGGWWMVADGYGGSMDGCGNELQGHELNGLNTHIVLIEDTKHKRSKFTGIALWEKLFVDFDKTLAERRETIRMLRVWLNNSHVCVWVVV